MQLPLFLRCTIIAFLLAARFTGDLPRAGAASPEDAHTKQENEPNHKRVLLLWQSPDGHAWSTHEYQDGVRIVARCLQQAPGLQTIVVQANEPWSEGPELLDGADGVFLFLAEGARWVVRDPARRAAFQKLAERGGGLVVLHWGMGTREAAPIETFVNLFGGCHGGPDRKYRVLTTRGHVRDRSHPVMRGIEPFEVEDEFYYRLKFAPAPHEVTPLLDVTIDDQDHTVAWAWERPGGGRSCGFSGGHFHKNWKIEAYRRLVVQSILWSVGVDIPETGWNVELPERELELTRPKPD